jgi:hypothetical protein
MIAGKTCCCLFLASSFEKRFVIAVILFFCAKRVFLSQRVEYDGRYIEVKFVLDTKVEEHPGRKTSPTRSIAITT